MIIKKYQHPIWFYVLATVLPWTCWFAAGYISHLEPLTRIHILLTSVLSIVGLLSPVLVAFAFISRDAELLQDLRDRLFSINNVKIRYWLMACLFMLVSILLAQAVSLFFGYSAHQFHFAESFSFTSGILPVWFLLIAAPFIEELAWHSYGTDCLRSRFSLFTASMMFAMYWGIWHFPLSSIQDYYHSNLVESGVVYSLNFLFSIFPFVIIMNWLYYKSNRNIWIAVIFHITAGFFNEIFCTHPMSKVIQTVLLIIFSVFLILNEKDFFFNKSTELH